MSTDPAIAAADPQASAWVAANAGAGKTHTLANRVTRLLLADAKPERILCLTYTKAAAAEMQHRLFERLGQWSMQPDEALRANIRDIGAEPDDLPKARRLFAQALETPGGLKILTIHAFCQNILSRFPVEAGVPPSFTVLDDQTGRELMDEARTRVLERAGSGDANLAAALAFLIGETSEATMNALLDASLGTDRRKLDRFFAELEADDGALFRAVRAAHGAPQTGSTREIAVSFCNELAEIAEDLRSIAEWMAAGSKTDKDRAAELVAALELKPGPAMFEAYRAIWLTKDGEPRKEPVTKKHSAARPALRTAVDRLQSDLLAAEEVRRATYAAELAEAALTVADAVRRAYASAKAARGALDYDDLIARTLELLERGSAAQWVLYKLDGGIEHVLIDEAQDTSQEQWRIVKALTGEFFAGEGKVRTLFAVGDEKQSIFSFQGADPAQFEQNREYFQRAAAAAQQTFVVAPLIRSRRSVPEVLNFVDAVFQSDAARRGLTSDGAGIVHKAHRESAKGRVEFWPALKPADAPERNAWRALKPIDVESEDSPVVRLARQIADQIAQWIGMVALPGHDRPIGAGDIMILLRRREPFGTEIIRRLKDRGVPVAGADRMQLTEQIAVMDLIALGRFVLLPEDDYNLAALLRSPLCALSEEDLFDLAHARGGTLWAEFQSRRGEPRYAEAHAFLTAMRAMADYAPPYEFYAHALGVRGMRLKLLKRLGHEANDAIDEFLALSFAYEAANTPSLEGFLHWVERGAAEVKRDMERGRDEVRVMTVHGAKGLEADIVILPDTTTLPKGTETGHLLYTDGKPLFPVRNEEAPAAVKAAKDAQKTRMLEEYRRLLYVALTRAKDRLIVCGFENSMGVHDESWYALARAAAEKLGVEVVRGGEMIRVVGEHVADKVRSAEPTAQAVDASRPAWLSAPAPRDAPAPRQVRPFDAAGIDEPATFSPLAGNRRFRRGLLVHALLAHLPEAAPDMRAALAREFLRAQSIPNTEAEALIGETLKVIEDPVFAAAFTPDSRAEIAIVADLPELGEGARVNGRVDRLAVADDHVLIVDFKTNRPPPATEAEVAPLYVTQMALYRAAARKIFPGRRIVCGLVWTDGPTLMELSDAFMDREMGRIRARLDPQGHGS